MVLAVSILLTIGITYSFYQSAKNKDAVRFTNEVSRIQSTIDNKINLYIALLNGGRGFIESTENITKKQFANYIRGLEIDKNYTGIQGIGYSKIFTADERESFIKQMKSEGFANFRNYPETNENILHSVIYFEPLTDLNKKEIGYNMSTEANQRTAMEKARDTGKAATSGKVKLISEDKAGEEENGFIIYLPIYKKDSMPQTVEERQENLSGYIYSPFKADDFLHEIESDTMRDSIAVGIYDGEENDENLLAQTNNLQNQTSGGRTDENYSSQMNFNVAGRKWLIRYSTLPVFAAQSSLGWTPLILISGIVFSFLLFGMTYWEASARADLEQTAGELFETEKQKQDLLEKEQKARQAAEKANRAKDEFISVVSHELKTPLNAISGWARILKNNSITDNTRDLAVKKIEKSLRSQTKLVNDLIDYTQIISGSYNFEGKEVNFSEVFEKTFLEFEDAANEKQIELLKDNKLNGHRILGDEERLKIVVYNLLTNAVKFTNEGGKIEAKLWADKGLVNLSVKDNGKGISSEYLPYVFEEFSQSDYSITRNFGGLGLGLTLSNHIVKIHDGTIEAKSEGKDKGSEFIVKIPLKST